MTRARGQIVQISLSDHPRGRPLGIRLAPACPTYLPVPSDSTLTVLCGWDRLTPREQGRGGDDDGGGGGRLGPIQRTGQVRLGDRLVGINGADVTALRFREVMDLLRDMILLPTPSGRGRKEKGGRGTGAGTGGSAPRLRSLSFEVAPSQELPTLSQAENGLEDVVGDSSSLFDQSLVGSGAVTGPLHHGVGGGDKMYTFASTIRGTRTTAAEGRGDDGHATSPCIEYEIVCRLSIRRPGGGGLQLGGGGGTQTDDVLWSVWKRYSALKELDGRLRDAFGWQIDALNSSWGLSFPGNHAFAALMVGNQSPGFVKRRRAELDSYWQSLLGIEDVFDFNPSSAKYSSHVAAFLEVGEHPPPRLARGGIDGAASVPSGFGYYKGHAADGGSTNGPLLLSSAAAGDEVGEGSSSPQRNQNELLNIVLESSVLDTSNLSTLSLTTPRTRRKRIPKSAKAAFQRSPMDEL